MSGTFEALNRALSELYDKYPDRKCTIVDTKSISMGAGLIVYYAAKLHNDGASDEEVAKFVENFRNKVRVYFTVDDLVYLKRGGRISSFKAGVGNLLNIKPMIGIKDGALLNVDSVKGRKKAINILKKKITIALTPLSFCKPIVKRTAKILSRAFWRNTRMRRYGLMQ